MQKKFNYYQDPSHGWVKVNRKLLHKLKIEDRITGFSYQKGDNVYLEEDCDLSVLIEALKLVGVTPKFIQRYTHRSSKIRSYHKYSLAT
jgi:hypothetical protein